MEEIEYLRPSSRPRYGCGIGKHWDQIAWSLQHCKFSIKQIKQRMTELQDVLQCCTCHSPCTLR